MVLVESVPKDQNHDEQVFDALFVKKLLSFIGQYDESEYFKSYRHPNEIFDTNKVVTSGSLRSFSSDKCTGQVYKRTSLEYNMQSTWTRFAYGVITSFRESEQSLSEFLQNSLLPELTKTIGNNENLYFYSKLQLKDTKKPRISYSGRKCLESGPSCYSRVCRLCYKNGEPEGVYTSHILRSADGTISCPILRSYVCELCGATGSYSHTRKYCPFSSLPSRVSGYNKENQELNLNQMENRNYGF